MSATARLPRQQQPQPRLDLVLPSPKRPKRRQLGIQGDDP
jgi:hypothetical protein